MRTKKRSPFLLERMNAISVKNLCPGVSKLLLEVNKVLRRILNDIPTRLKVRLETVSTCETLFPFRQP